MVDEDGIVRFKTYGGQDISISQDLLLTKEMTDAHMIWFYLVSVDPNDPDLLVVSQSRTT